MNRQGSLPRAGMEDLALQDVLESLPLPVHYKNLAGVVQGCNRALAQFLDRPREEVAGRTDRELFPPEEAQELAAQDEELVRKGGRLVFRMDHRLPDGQVRHLLVGKGLWIDGGGGVAGVVTQFQDITEFRELEAEHLESEARMRALLDGLQEREAQFRALFVAGNGIKLLLAPEGGWILDANPAAESFLGYDLSTLRTMSISEFSGLEPVELSDTIQRVIDSGSEKFIRKYRLAGGEVRDVEVYAAPVVIKGKTYVWATLHDITDGMAAEAALRASEDRLKSLAESIQAIVFRFEKDGTCTYVNGHYQRLTGLDPGPVLARKWAKVIHPQDRERILDGWKTARKLVQVHETEFRLLNARDQELWVLGRTTPERDSEGNLVGFLTTCTDITRMRRAEEALRLAAKHESLGLMAGAIANDFNNILQAVWTSLDLLEGDPGRSAEALAWARESLGKGKRVAQFIQQYSGRGAGAPVPVDLGRHIQAFAAENPAPEGEVSLEALAGPGLPRVLMDPDQLTHCLKVMVANAQEALGAGPGSIRILARRPSAFNPSDGVWILSPQPGPSVELAVENDGPSIPREELHRIFDPYYTTKEAGRGLGLSSVLGILRSHGAGLWAESVPDAGVRIRVLLAVGGRVSAEAASLPAGPGAVLVVDDQPEVLRVVSRLLESLFDRPVLTASGGEEALEVVRIQGGDLAAVLMDANMPGMDGTAAFTAIRALRPGLPGVLFSGCDREQGLELARTYGFTGFIKKPFEAEELREAFAPLLTEG